MQNCIYRLKRQVQLALIKHRLNICFDMKSKLEATRAFDGLIYIWRNMYSWNWSNWKLEQNGLQNKYLIGISNSIFLAIYEVKLYISWSVPITNDNITDLRIWTWTHLMISGIIDVSSLFQKIQNRCMSVCVKHVCDKDIGYYKRSTSNLCQYEKWAKSSMYYQTPGFDEGYEVLI